MSHGPETAHGHGGSQPEASRVITDQDRYDDWIRSIATNEPEKFEGSNLSDGYALARQRLVELGWDFGEEPNTKPTLAELNPGAAAGLYDMAVEGGVLKVTLPSVEISDEHLTAIAEAKRQAISRLAKSYEGMGGDKDVRASKRADLGEIEKHYKQPGTREAYTITDASKFTDANGKEQDNIIENRGEKVKDQIDAATPAIQASIRAREAALAAGKSIDEAYDLGAAEYARVLIHNGTPPDATEPQEPEPITPQTNTPRQPPSPNNDRENDEPGPAPVEKERLYKKLRRFGNNVLTTLKALRPDKDDQPERRTKQVVSNIMLLTPSQLSRLYKEHGFTLQPDHTQPILDYLNQRMVNLTRDTIVDELGVEKLKEFDKLPKTARGEKAFYKWIDDNMPTLRDIIDRKFKDILDGEDFAKLRGVFDGSIPIEPILMDHSEGAPLQDEKKEAQEEESVMHITRDELVNELGFDGPEDQIQPIINYLNIKVMSLVREAILKDLGQEKLKEFDKLPKSPQDEDIFYDWIENNMPTKPYIVEDTAQDILRSEDFAAFIGFLKTGSIT